MSGRKQSAQQARRGRSVMSKALVLGVAALALSASGASAQVYVSPGYGYGSVMGPHSMTMPHQVTATQLQRRSTTTQLQHTATPLRPRSTITQLQLMRHPPQQERPLLS